MRYGLSLVLAAAQCGDPKFRGLLAQTEAVVAKIEATEAGLRHPPSRVSEVMATLRVSDLVQGALLMVEA